MKSAIKRGLALTVIAATGCATGLLTPASAVAGDPPAYRIESVLDRAVLTALPYGPITLTPSGEAPGQVWTVGQSSYGTTLVNRDSGQCLATTGAFFGAPVIQEPCSDVPTQVWQPRDSQDGNVVLTTRSSGCLNADFDRVWTGICAYTAQWRLVPA